MTIPASAYTERRARVTERLADRDEDALLVWGEPHGSLGLLGTPNDIGYLAEWPLRQPGSGPAVLVVPQDGVPALLVAGPRYAPVYARERTELADVRRVDPADFATETKAVFDDRGIDPDQLGVVRWDDLPVQVADRLTAAFGPDRLTDATDLFETIRMTKREPAITALERAAGICDELFGTCSQTVTPDAEYHTVLTELEGHARDRGTEFVTTWLASGPRGGTYPAFEPDPGGRAIADGDLVVIGIQLLNDNHWGHAIRAGVVGEPTRDQQALYQVVDEVRQTVFERARPGVDIADLHDTVQSIYADAGYEPCFRTLHGLGLQYGGPPAFPQSGPEASVPSLELQPGMVFEIHPNIWAGPDGAEFIAVGDMAVVTDTGIERLTTAPEALARW
ncbi:MAG: M24 family metallopeptidase [Halobacteriales archaeon]|nr:M24 family metallopeptidase [Halobacteriales archaeon]